MFITSQPRPRPHVCFCCLYLWRLNLLNLLETVWLHSSGELSNNLMIMIDLDACITSSGWGVLRRLFCFLFTELHDLTFWGEGIIVYLFSLNSIHGVIIIGLKWQTQWCNVLWCCNRIKRIAFSLLSVDLISVIPQLRGILESDCLGGGDSFQI